MREIYTFKITHANAFTIRIAVRANSQPSAWIAMARDRAVLARNVTTGSDIASAIQRVAFHGDTAQILTIERDDPRHWERVRASVAAYNAEAHLSAAERFSAFHAQRIAEEIEIETDGYPAFLARRAGAVQERGS